MSCEELRNAGVDFDCCRSCHSDEIVDYMEEETYKGVNYALCCAGVEAVKDCV